MPQHQFRRWIGAWALAILLTPVAGQGQAPPLTVPLGTVRSVDVPFVLQGIGSVQAFNSVTVRAQVDGILQRLDFAEGRPVRAGQVLGQIDPRPFQAVLDQALARQGQNAAQLQNARLNLQRVAGIGDFASRQQLATQEAAVAQLEATVRGDQAAIDGARTQLGYTNLTSPINGIAGIRLVDPGNLMRAAEATGIGVVNQVRPINVVFTLPGDSVGAIRQAMASGGPLPVTVLDRQAGRRLGEGSLVLVDNQIDPATGMVRLKAVLPNEDEALWPGAFVDVQLRLRVDRGVRTVPSTAVQRGPDGTWLYVVADDGTVTPAKITVDRFGEGQAVLSEGPPPGTRIVASGQQRLAPGLRVTERP